MPKLSPSRSVCGPVLCRLPPQGTGAEADDLVSPLRKLRVADNPGPVAMRRASGRAVGWGAEEPPTSVRSAPSRARWEAGELLGKLELPSCPGAVCVCVCFGVLEKGAALHGGGRWAPAQPLLAALPVWGSWGSSIMWSPPLCRRPCRGATERPDEDEGGR